MLSALLTIAALHWAVLLVPGFNFIFISQLAASGARREALAAVGGMTTGTLVWALLAVAGVGVVFAAHPQLRFVAQIAGGLYLLQMAWKLWATRNQPGEPAPRTWTLPAAYRAGLFTSLLNPKLALFYGSVFATALPASPTPGLYAAAVALVFGNSVVWHLGLAQALSRPVVQRAWLRHLRRLNQASGLVVGAFGAQLLTQTWQEWRRGGA